MFRMFFVIVAMMFMAASSAKAEDGFDFGVDSGNDYADYGPAGSYDIDGIEVNFYDFDSDGTSDNYRPCGG